MRNVLFITNIPSPYRVRFFNELAKKVNLTVIYERKKASDRNDSWSEKININYKSIFLSSINIKNDSSFSFQLLKYLQNEKYDDIVFTNISSFTSLVGINYCIVNKIPYFIEGDGAFYKKNLIKDIIKRKVIKNAKICFSTCEELTNYYLKLGSSKEKIRLYHFSSLNNDDLLDNKISSTESDQLFPTGYSKYILFVGQFIHRKGIDLLLKAAAELSDDYCFLFVGGKPTDKYLKLIDNLKLNNIYFYDFNTREQLANFYKSSNLLVLPTREDIWGLVVNEALSFGTPVVTTDRCNAGLTLMKNNLNGIVVKANNVDELVKGIDLVISNTNKYTRNECFLSVKDYTIEQMVEDHLKVFNE